MVQIYDGYNDGNNEDYIKSLLEKVKGSYPCSGDDSNFEEKFNYSKLVNKYAEATTNYLELIKKDLTKEANKHWMLDEHSWNIQMEYSDEYEESKRHYHDCFLFQDCFMAISHPGAFPGYEHVVDKASIQVKVVTYREEFKKFLLPLSKEIYYPQTGRVQPRELSSLRTIDYYVWLYWSQTEHKFKGMFILRNPKCLLLPIITGSGIVEVEKKHRHKQKNYIKTVLYLNPNHIAFPSHEFLTDEPPLLH